jgi:carbamoyl-phosphate synthase large subunit
VTILATSVGNDGFPSVLQALKDAPDRDVVVVGVDARREAAGLALSDVGVVVPPRSRPEALLTALLSLCRKHHVDVLFPLSTEDQEFFAAQRGLFVDDGVGVAVSDLACLEIANDKLALLDACRKAGIPCPRYHPVTSLEDLERGAESLGFPDAPFVLKLNRGTGMSGVKVVHAAIDPLDRLLDRYNLNVPYDAVAAALASIAGALPPMHVVEYLPGQEYSVDVLCREGEVISSVVRARMASLFGLATHGVVRYEATADATARAVVGALRLSFVANVQLRDDQSGVPRLMEVNPRIPGTIGLTVAAGVNMPYSMVKLALGEPLGPVATAREGTEAVRYWSLAVIDEDDLCG